MNERSTSSPTPLQLLYFFKIYFLYFLWYIDKMARYKIYTNGSGCSPVHTMIGFIESETAFTAAKDLVRSGQIGVITKKTDRPHIKKLLTRFNFINE